MSVELGYHDWAVTVTWSLSQCHEEREREEAEMEVGAGLLDAVTVRVGRRNLKTEMENGKG